ncbi:Ti-type conjugative transfer relaxase TraA [Legionella geestiana]|uniref:Ti-type conjugative transfer relaxase TraA n=1 Tax=Legionella geestiana TaxID=45065 RepID=UPI00109327D8|nr:Ti-type conjugative transfer relaxase TraA [Legionella geestiana]QDQ40261.1 Ti-type conjugative transfer relaxase TraA [Legionella geestiana]
MAIAFARVSVHSRSKGHSAIAASAYRSASRLYDERTGVTHDFSNRKDVVFSEILLPQNGSGSYTNREFLWNQAEAAEKRRDSQLCKDVVLALPKELDLPLQIELAKRFAMDEFVKHGLPADIAIHHHDGNPHAHILIPTRRLEKEGFSRYKARDLNPSFAKGRVVENDYWGERWRECQNHFFAEKNLDVSVDINHLIPGRHQGKIRDAAVHYLADENHVVQEARRETVQKDVTSIIHHLFSKHSVFTRRDVEKLLFKTFKNSEKPEEYLHHVERVMSNRDIIELGANERGKVCYTTRQQYIQEARLRHDIESMMRCKKHETHRQTDTLSQQYNLSAEQQEAFRYMVDSPAIRVVIGRPGTGKSYLLKPVKEFYQKNRYQVIGCSLSGKVAKALQADTGITSSTIASLVYRLNRNQLKLTKKHVLVMDEAGMVDCHNMSFLLHKAKKAGAKVILVGDPDQLKPIHKGEIFRGIAAVAGFIELENIKRQRDAGDRQASLDMARGDMGTALHHYHEKGAIMLCDTAENTRKTLIADWQKTITRENLKDTVLLSFTRAAVADLNEKARQTLQDKQIVGRENIVFQGYEKPLQISVGERLLFRQNDKTVGVRNGDLATVQAIRGKALEVKLDTGELLTIPEPYRAIDYGYALTVHKSQGMTVDNASVLVDSKYWDKNLSFVAMTRHRQNLKVYADKENHPSFENLKHSLSRSVTRDNVIDWPLDFAIRSGFTADSLVSRVVRHVAGVGKKIKDGLNFIVMHERVLLDKNQRSEVRPHADSALTRPNFEALKTENAMISKYEKILSDKKHLTGYFLEKAEKELVHLSKSILSDKNLTGRLQSQFPDFYKKIQMNTHERNRVQTR